MLYLYWEHSFSIALVVNTVSKQTMQIKTSYQHRDIWKLAIF